MSSDGRQVGTVENWHTFSFREQSGGMHVTYDGRGCSFCELVM